MAKALDMSVAVIGAGFTGLSAAYEAARRGARVTVFEKDSFVGGLASTFKIGEESFERYHHFVCKTDLNLIGLLKELGMTDRLKWRQTRLGYFVDGKVVPFTGPLEMLCFPGLSLLQKIQWGAGMISLVGKKDWEAIEYISARDWMIRRQGHRCYEIIWRHLMERKFGPHVEEVPLSWLWARSSRRASGRKPWSNVEIFGHLENSFSEVAEELIKYINSNGGQIRSSTAVEQIESSADRVHIASGLKTETFDRAIVTIPLPHFAQVAPELPDSYLRRIARIKYAGIVNAVVKLDRDFTPFFWLNISDTTIRFPGIIEFSHLRRPSDGSSLLYIPDYSPPDSPEFNRSNEQVNDDCLMGLRKIKPGFSESDVRAIHIFRDPYADPYYCLGYSEVIPPVETPIPHVFLANTSQIYPITRSVQNSIGLGRKVVSLVMEAK